MMYKKMKGVVLESSSYVGCDDPKTRFKHQTLMQEYLELHKESETMRNKLKTLKHRKLTLLAEVRFLNRRYKFLLKNNSPSPSQEQQQVKQQDTEKQRKKIMMHGIQIQKGTALRKLPPIFDLNHKGGKNTENQSVFQNAVPIFDATHKLTLHGGKEAGPQNATPRFELNQKKTFQGRKEEAALQNLTPFSDLNQRRRLYSRKDHILQTQMPTIDLNQKQRIYSGNEAAPRNPAPLFDLNQKGSIVSVKESSSQRGPIFDLNQISEEEEEFQNNFELVKIEDPTKCLIRGGSDEQPNDVKLSVCRNVGDGGSARVGKRKISWQDPVALRV